MKNNVFTDRELEISGAIDWQQYSDKEIADFARKEHERTLEMKLGEFDADCRKRQASIAFSIIRQLAGDCESIEKKTARNKDKIEAGKLRSKFEALMRDFQSGFGTLGELAGWWNQGNGL